MAVRTNPEAPHTPLPALRIQGYFRTVPSSGKQVILEGTLNIFEVPSCYPHFHSFSSV